MLDSSKQINNTLINQQNWGVTLSPPSPENQKTFTRKPIALAIKSPQGAFQKQETESKARQKWIYNKWGIIALSLRKERTVMEGNKLRKTHTWINIEEINLAEWPFWCPSFHQCDETFQKWCPSQNPCGLGWRRQNHRITQSIRLGKSPKSTESNLWPIPSCHPEQSHIQALLEHLQERGLHHQFPGHSKIHSRT